MDRSRCGYRTLFPLLNPTLGLHAGSSYALLAPAEAFAIYSKKVHEDTRVKPRSKELKLRQASTRACPEVFRA